MPGKSAVPATKIHWPVFTQEQLKQIAEFVLRESAAGEVRSAISIGRYLLGRLFQASEEVFRSKDPMKPDSLRDLAEQPGMADAGWGRTRLQTAIEVALLARAHRDLRAWRFLRVSHYEEVIGLPAEKQRELLDLAEKEKWPVARLGREAGKARAQAAGPAKPASMSPERALSRLRKVMAQLEPLAEEEAVESFLVPSGIDARAAAEFTATIQKGLGLLQGFQKELEGMKKGAAGRRKRVAGKAARPR